ncbi:MAG TPA: ABC transporter substrate-binding protein [Candidatus Binataceae bacterium]|nr:ABC transporter substrate-binding protein [Candidatus Binataceae bacterium]
MPEVKAVLTQAIAVLQDTQLPLAQRRQRLRELAEAHFDFATMARSSLGYHWKNLSPPQQEQFVALFSSFIEDAYLDKIQGYVNLKFEVARQRMNGPGYAEVDTKVIQTQGSPINLNFQLEKKNGDWKVYDVQIDNISMVDNYRTQFNHVINERGFNVLVSDLQRKQRELASLLGNTQAANR